MRVLFATGELSFTKVDETILLYSEIVVVGGAIVGRLEYCSFGAQWRQQLLRPSDTDHQSIGASRVGVRCWLCTSYITTCLAALSELLICIHFATRQQQLCDSTLSVRRLFSSARAEFVFLVVGRRRRESARRCSVEQSSASLAAVARPTREHTRTHDDDDYHQRQHQHNKHKHSPDQRTTTGYGFPFCVLPNGRRWIAT